MSGEKENKKTNTKHGHEPQADEAASNHIQYYAPHPERHNYDHVYAYILVRSRDNLNMPRTFACTKTQKNTGKTPRLKADVLSMETCDREFLFGYIFGFSLVGDKFDGADNSVQFLLNRRRPIAYIA